MFYFKILHLSFLWEIGETREEPQLRIAGKGFESGSFLIRRMSANQSTATVGRPYVDLLSFSWDTIKRVGWCSRCSDWLRAGRPRGRISNPGGGKHFHFSMSSRPALGPTQPPIQWVQRTLSPGVKRPGCEADHLPPTSAEVKKMWVYIHPLPHTSSWRSA
jgi:hypothetical protein